MERGSLVPSDLLAILCVIAYDLCNYICKQMFFMYMKM